MFHIRVRERAPKKGDVVVARCGKRIVYEGTMWRAKNEECCPKCLSKYSPGEKSHTPKYIMPESEEDIENSADKDMWCPAL